MQPRTRFLIAALAAAPMWVALSAVAPTGETWKWLEYPWLPSLLALGTAVVACAAAKHAAAAIAPILAAWAGSIAHERLEFPGWDLPHYIDVGSVQLAPWLVGGLACALVVLALGGAGRRATGAWLVASGAAGAAIALANDAWRPFENFQKPGTLIEHGMWSDTKVLALGLALATAAAGLALLVARGAAPIPTARLRRRR